MDYVRALAENSTSAMQAYCALTKEDLPDDVLMEAKYVWLRQDMAERVKDFHSKGHARWAAENLVRRNMSSLSDEDVNEILDVHQWSDQK